MTIMEKVIALHEVDLFAHMGTEELSYVAAIAEEDQFDTGEAIFAANEPADSLHLILSGAVSVYQGEQEIFEARRGDSLGALALLDGEPWLLGSRVKEPTQSLRIDRETFLDLLSDYPSITQAILGNLVKRVRRLVQASQTDANTGSTNA
jgi:CRP-like cAMP-binding protein